MESESHAAEETSVPRWQPLPRIQRRVLGVLVEKAKTTPNGYPMTLNSIITGCNQKSNRYPQMEVETETVEDALTVLRQAGAVGEIQDGGRVPKYRHYSKEWLGVDGAGLAVMAELLLRGAQTIGELRGRAARMAHGQLPDMAALRPVLDSLKEKGLLIELTPGGRGQVVTHALYEADELARVRAKHGGGAAEAESVEHPAPPAAATSTAAALPPTPPHGTSASVPPATTSEASLAAIQRDLAELRTEMDRLKKEVEDIWSNLGN